MKTDQQLINKQRALEHAKGDSGLELQKYLGRYLNLIAIEI